MFFDPLQIQASKKPGKRNKGKRKRRTRFPEPSIKALLQMCGWALEDHESVSVPVRATQFVYFVLIFVSSYCFILCVYFEHRFLLLWFPISSNCLLSLTSAWYVWCPRFFMQHVTNSRVAPYCRYFMFMSGKGTWHWCIMWGHLLSASLTWSACVSNLV